VQGGISYGADGSSDSHHPGLWVEFYSSSGYCSTNFCGTWTTTAATDNDNWEVSYLTNPTNEWLLYAQDSTVTPTNYITYYDSTHISETYFTYGLVAMEGHGANSAGYWPGSATFWDTVGEDTNGNYLLGTNGYFNSPSGTSLTATVTYTTTTCYANSGCASVGLGMS
jgi:hypothetical protein